MLYFEVGFSFRVSYLVKILFEEKYLYFWGPWDNKPVFLSL